jgi:sodium/bile acid cotransporter 7
VQSWFLPIGLIAAVAAAWLVPGPGAWLKDAGLVPWLVATIFLVNGYQIRLRETPVNRSLLLAFAALTALTLIAGPAMGTAAARLAALPGPLAVGLIVIAAMPSTLSSAIVMTEVARGNTAWALMLTLALNVAGIVIVPFTLAVALHLGGEVALSPWPLLAKLVVVVLLPFMLGQTARYLGRRDWPRVVVRYVPSACIIAGVWMALASAHDTLTTVRLVDLIAIAIAALAVHGALLLLSRGTALVLGLDRGATWAVVLTGSQKTLPVAISVLAGLPGGTGVAVVSAVVFHFLHLMLDSALVARARAHAPR